jgi:tyrosyl-tRNA synthetase
MMNLSDELAWRGFVNQTTFKDIAELDAQKRTFYWGVDPSAASMQIGNLAAAMMARVFIRHGYTPILLVGGATGQIGDPDGKAQERDLKTLDEIAANKAGIVAQYQQVFDGVEFEVVDNFEWFKNMNYLSFLRDVGKHVPLRQMLSRDFVQSRLGEDGAGISYAEFSYSLIQGYDFLWLAENKEVTLQLSGADQWGNSIAGVDLIRRKLGKEAHVWTCPLVINKATGIKFGKTEGGAVWLDPQLTSPYKFYQFWLNVDDEGVIDYMKIYTTLDKTEIDKIASEFEQNKSSRNAQKALAYEVTKLVHGAQKADAVVHATQALFGGQTLSESDAEVLRTELTVVPSSADLYEVLVHAGLASSKSEARQFVAGGAVSVNGQKITPETERPFTEPLNLIKRGKNTFALVER